MEYATPAGQSFGSLELGRGPIQPQGQAYQPVSPASIPIPTYHRGEKPPGKARLIVIALLFVGLAFIAVGVPTNAMLQANASNGATAGYFQSCDSNSINPTCHSLVKDYWNCAFGQSPAAYAYSGNFSYYSNAGMTAIDQTACIQQVSAEVAGLVAAVFCAIAVVTSVLSYFNRLSPVNCAVFAILGTALDMGALIVFMVIVPTFTNLFTGFTGYSYIDYVNSGYLKVYYSFILQIIGIFFTFVGALVAICAKRIEESNYAV